MSEELWLANTLKDVRERALTRDEILSKLHEDISVDLAAIGKRFKSGYRLTLIGRHPNKPNQDLCVTGEDETGNKREQFLSIEHTLALMFKQAPRSALKAQLKECVALLEFTDEESFEWTSRRDALLAKIKEETK